MSIKKLGIIIAVASITILAIVMTVTQSIWAHYIFKYYWSHKSRNALMGSVFSGISLVVMAASFYLFFIKKINKFGFVALGLAVFLLFIALIVPLSSQHEMYKVFPALSATHLKDPAPAFAINASHVYMVNIIFASALSVGAIAGTVTHFAAQK